MVQVVEGSGKMLVLAVGRTTEWGRLLELVGEAGDDETPLQQKLGDLAGAIGKVGFSVAVACFVALLTKCAAVGLDALCLASTSRATWMGSQLQRGCGVLPRAAKQVQHC